MKYRVGLTVVQQWVVEVEADNPVGAQNEAKLVYDSEPNPWEVLESVGDEQVSIQSITEMAAG